MGNSQVKDVVPPRIQLLNISTKIGRDTFASFLTNEELTKVYGYNAQTLPSSFYTNLIEKVKFCYKESLNPNNKGFVLWKGERVCILPVVQC